MGSRIALLILFFSSIFLLKSAAKNADPYKVLGTDRNASQREIQKAFHKLSLKYHPDKNKNKGAQEKFSEINNAYDILSDQEKRKRYDMYGDEKGDPGFQSGYPEDQGSYTHFTGGQNQHNFRSSDWQNMGGHGVPHSYSFSFGGSDGSIPFNLGFGDMFSNLFGGVGYIKSGGRFGGSNSRARTQSKIIRPVSIQVYKADIVGKGITWLLFSYTPSNKQVQRVESVVKEVAISLDGALEAGSINCEVEKSLCKEHGISPRDSPRIFVYSFKGIEKGLMVEYIDEWTVKNLKTFCQDNLPTFSKRLELKQFEFTSPSDHKLPVIMLLSIKKDTPVIWRVLTGLYHKRFIFYDAQVHDVTEATAKKLSVDALPAIVGWLSNGEKHILKKGISVKNLKSAVHDLSVLLDGFEKKNKKALSETRKEHAKPNGNQVPLLAASNFDALCSDTTPVCIIGVFRSSKGKEKLGSILKMVSQKTLSRRQSSGTGLRDGVSYSLLDAAEQLAFLTAFEKSGFKSSDVFLVAYKPRKGKFATFQGPVTVEEVEGFIGSVLSGDAQFTKTRHKPVLE